MQNGRCQDAKRQLSGAIAMLDVSSLDASLPHHPRHRFALSRLLLVRFAAVGSMVCTQGQALPRQADRAGHLEGWGQPARGSHPTSAQSPRGSDARPPVLGKLHLDLA